MKLFHIIPAPWVLWGVFIGSFTSYLSCIKNFSERVRTEKPELWSELRQLQDGSNPVNAGRIFLSFLKLGKFQDLDNGRISHAGFWVGISGVVSGISASIVYWYYMLYLPYQK